MIAWKWNATQDNRFRLAARINSELRQNVELKRNVVNKILLSKRLLIDHVECLEFCLDELPSDERSTNIFTFLNCSLSFGVSSFLNFMILKQKPITAIILSSTSGIFTTLYGVKLFNKYQNKLFEGKLDRLIKIIENFGTCVKRNVSYFNEVQFIHFSQDDHVSKTWQKERIWECIRSIKDVTVLLYDETRKLEELHELSAKFSELYLPMEELRECDYFKKDITECNSKNIKDFYNIFAYVQSQFFLRLAFTILENKSTDFFYKDLDNIIKCIEVYIRDNEEYFRKLSNNLQKRKKEELSNLHKSHELHKIQFSPSSILKESSLKLSSGLIAVAEECYKLDEALQRISDEDHLKTEDTQNLIDLANSMRTIENSLSVCCDNFQRLMIIYNKFLGGKLNHDDGNSLEVNEEELSEADKTTAPQLTTESFEQEKSDDFYAYMFDEQSEDTDQNCGDNLDKSLATDYQLFNLDENITKKKFKPVLQQLKDKIDPIRQEMLEKERKVLEAKGVNVDKLFAPQQNGSEDEGDSIESGDEGSSIRLQRKVGKRKPNDTFDEMREFLAQKSTSNPSINLFKLQLPMENIVNEDILE